MDMMSVLWQVGIFASVLVFGVKIGLASGLYSHGINNDYCRFIHNQGMENTW